MKKTLFALFALVVGSFVSPLVALADGADTFELGDFKYRRTSANTVEVAGLSKGCTNTDVSVPKNFKYEGVGYTVTKVGEQAFRWTDITSITLPETVDTLAYCAFYGAGELTYVGLPTTMKYWGDYALASTKIRSVVVPEGIKEIPYSCFFTCRKLENITLPSTLKNIRRSAFYKCEALTQIDIPEGVDSIGCSFLYCNMLERVSLPSTLRYIGEGCFNNCVRIHDISIPSAVEEIGDEAFLQCPLITDVVLPRSLKKLGGAAFAETALTNIAIEEGNTNFKLVDGLVYNAQGTIVCLAPMKNISTCTIADGCLGISYGAFWGSDVTKVVLPESMVAIDEYAFCKSQLRSITFPVGVKYFGTQAFAGCKLVNVTLPESLVELPEACFAQCLALTDVTIPSTLKFIYNRAFWQCRALSTIHCLGTVPAEFDDWYDADENPLQATSGVTLSVPAGYTSVYKAAQWGTFDNIKSIIDYEAPVMLVKSYAADGVKADDGGVSTFKSISVTFDTDKALTAVSGAYIKMYEEDTFFGPSMGAAKEWRCESDGKQTVTFTPLDAGGQPVGIDLVTGYDYYVVIPTASARADNAANEHLELLVKTPAPEPVGYSVSPAPDSDVDVLNSVVMKFDEPVYVYTTDSKCTLKKVSTGEEVVMDMWFADEGSDSLTMTVYPCDVDFFNAYIHPLKLDRAETYELSIPEGFILSYAHNAPNKAMTVYYTGMDNVENIHHVAATPASDAVVGELSVVTLTYGEDVSVKNLNPHITVTKGAMDGEVVEGYDWQASVLPIPGQKNVLRLTAGILYEGVFTPLAMPLDRMSAYYVHVPKNICEGVESSGRSAEAVIEVNGTANGIHGVTVDSDHSKFLKVIDNGRVVLRNARRVYNVSGQEMAK